MKWLAFVLLLVAAVAQAQEKVAFPSRDADLSEGVATRLDGYFHRPAGPGPFPAVVMHHGCGGMWSRGGRLGARDAWWARHFVERGFVALAVDSFVPRGMKEVCGNREASATVSPKRSRDSYGALAWLGARPDIDRNRIAVVGWSHGGSTVLGTAWKGQPGRTPDLEFRVAIAFYPGCAPWARDPGARLAVPLMILIGEADDWTPAPPCRSFAERLLRLDQPVELVLDPGAYHQFDAPNQPRTVLPDIRNAAGGLGVTLASDPAARADAIARVDAMLDLMRR